MWPEPGVAMGQLVTATWMPLRPLSWEREELLMVVKLGPSVAYVEGFRAVDPGGRGPISALSLGPACGQSSAPFPNQFLVVTPFPS